MDLERRREIEAHLTEAAGTTPAFLILMVLSTLIASYGLLSNSTATVIGAMLVAPLMGPILGLALGLSQGRSDVFLRALRAEGLGILICLVVSALVACLAGTGNIDYLQSEIANRTQPTLYDLAIGLAAGLAGAYATTNPRVGDSIGGVAIAVALVPPLAVCGLSLAGALAGRDLWSYAGGSFLLFLANFLTIELAAAGLFLWVGVGHLSQLKRSKGLLRGLGIQLGLLLLTLFFLAAQLNSLLARRSMESQARRVAVLELAGVPGASLDRLDLRVQRKVLVVSLLVRSPRPIESGLIDRMQQRLARSLGREVELEVGTILSTYYTSEGRRYEPREPLPDPEQSQRARLVQSLQKALASFPAAQLDNARWLDDRRALVTLRSSYEFDSSLVARLAAAARADYGVGFPELTVRTLLSRDYTSNGAVQAEELPRDAERSLRQQAQRQLDQTLRELVDEVAGGSLLEARFELVSPESSADGPLPTPVSDAWLGRTLRAQVVVRSAAPLTAEQVGAWERSLTQKMGVQVQLEVDNRLGRTVRAVPAPP